MGEAAQLLGIHRDTLRRWERRGLFKARRDWRGARVFDAADLERLRILAGLDAEVAGSGGGGGRASS